MQERCRASMVSMSHSSISLFFYYCYNAFLLYLSTHTHTNPQMNAPRATWYLVFYPRIFPHADWRSPLPPELQPPQLVTMVQRDLLHTGLKSHTSATQHCTRDKGQAFLGVFYSYTVLQTPAPEQDINNKSADMHIICKEFSNRTPTIKHCMNSCVMGWMKLKKRLKKKYFECSVRVVTCYLKPECVFAWNRNAYVPMFR